MLGLYCGQFIAALRCETRPNALTFMTMTTRPSFRAEFKAGEGGKTAVYMARWINTRGEKGPWSEITTATVAA
jgi:hypothetical protein